MAVTLTVQRNLWKSFLGARLYEGGQHTLLPPKIAAKTLIEVFEQYLDLLFFASQARIVSSGHLE